MKSLHMHTSPAATLPWLVHHFVPTIHPFHQHFVNFPVPRHCHSCSESSHIAAFGCSHPPCHPQPGVTPLQHQPQRPFFWEAGTHWGPTTTLQLPPAMFCSCTHVHLHFQPDCHIWTCHSSTWGSLAHCQPQKPSFQLVGAPIKCPPPPPISLQHSVHACMHAF